MMCWLAEILLHARTFKFTRNFDCAYPLIRLIYVSSSRSVDARVVRPRGSYFESAPRNTDTYNGSEHIFFLSPLWLPSSKLVDQYF